MMTATSGFPEEDLCPTKRELIAFKKAHKTPKKALEEIKEAQEAKKEKTMRNDDLPAEIPQKRPKEVEHAPPLPSGKDGFQYLPNLKPGPDGKFDWTPLGTMTGTRPDVNKYSLSRYSLSEWRKQNERVLDPEIINCWK